MFDAHLEVHSNPVDVKYEPLEGFTYGFGVHDSSSSESDSDDERPPHNLRWIDRIHVSKSLLPHLSEALTAFIARADHEAVLVSCKPPEFDLASCRFRCPTEILQDDEAIEQLQSQLKELPGTPLQCWEMPYKCSVHQRSSTGKHIHLHKSTIFLVLCCHPRRTASVHRDGAIYDKKGFHQRQIPPHILC